MNRSKKIVLGIILFSFCKLSVGYSRVLTVPAENNADTVCRNAACATSSVSACTNAGSYPCCDPSGTCRSLRAAVRQAVLYEPDPTTINLAPATTSEVTYSVNCTNGTLSADDASLSGDIDLVYSGAPKPVTINGVVGAAGVSRNLITIKCINQSAGLPIGDYSIDRERVFDISGHMIVNLNNVNLESDAGTNALGNSSLGGGVTIRNGATFRMSHVLMKNNVALQGGAIYAVSGSTVLVGDTDGNEFEGNNAFGTARADGQGGAIYVNDAAVTVKKSTFIENTASFDGGAIYVANTPPSTPVNLYQSTLYNNEATKGFGGAIAVSNPGSLNIERTSVVLNKANEGGG